MNVGDACQEWIKGNSLKQRQPGSAAINVRAAKVIGGHAIASVPVDALPEEAVHDFAVQLLETTYIKGNKAHTYSTEYVCQMLSFLRKTVNWLNHNNKLPTEKNPSKAISRVITEVRSFAGDDESIKAYTKSQMTTILEAITDPQFRLLIFLAVTTGLRQGELLGLQWEDIHWEGSKIMLARQVRSCKTSMRLKGRKRAAHKLVAVPPQTLEALKNAERKSKWVFCTRGGGPIDDRNIRRSWDATLAKCPEIPRLTFHGLRHTFASVALQSGCSILFVSQTLGHHSPAFTWEVYAHLLPDEAVNFNHADFGPATQEVA